MLSANDMQVHNDATVAIAAINKLMKAKGYKYKTSKQSALFETNYIKDDTNIVLVGWHGDGRYGNVKTILDLYVGKLSTFEDTKRIVTDANDPNRVNWLQVNPKLHKEGIDIILEYLKLNAWVTELYTCLLYLPL